MGKKKQLKYIRKIAEELQSKTLMTSEFHLVQGSVLIAQGHIEFDGKPIEIHKFYKERMPVEMEVNHARQMKKALNQKGIEGVKAYLKTCKRKTA